jgi:hypothetical protein
MLLSGGLSVLFYEYHDFLKRLVIWRQILRRRFVFSMDICKL